LKIEQMDRHLRGVIRNLCPKKTGGYAPVGSTELERQKKLCDKRASDWLERWADEQRNRLSWFKEDDLALIKNAGGPELQVLTEPPFKFGWRTGREALLGEKRTVEEAIVSRRTLQDAKRTAPGPAPPLPQVTKPAAPKSQLKPPGPASLGAGEMDLELAPDDSQDDLLDRLPLGWEKKMAAVDRKWFLGDQNLFLTDVELRTYVQRMGWADSSNSSREDWLRIIVENLDAALSGAPKGKRDRLPKAPVNPPVLPPRDKNGAFIKKKNSSSTPPASDNELPPGGAGVDRAWEREGGMPRVTTLVAAMQDRARLDWALSGGQDEVPNLLLSWLWFRRYILAYPERCTSQEDQCHILKTQGRSKWSVTEAEYPPLLRGQSPDHPWIQEFNDQIDWFRTLILSSPVICLTRYDGSLAGELGLAARSAVTYSQV
jgi:hypothetical protein